ncbi:hypothetical protein EYF80_014427 [Liparis tanakae]|uniref:Uncharacterized protein n=1 Tax=Liparis tanakae TaxID=230148 RepID=A0A4Z2IBV9_9TELE|nr:hypothetical protein EYF80_014427 [Liparis tanakae]
MGKSGGQSEEHYRGENKKGDTGGEMRKDEDIKCGRIYEMRVEENKGQWRQERREFVACGHLFFPGLKGEACGLGPPNPIPTKALEVGQRAFKRV